MKPPVGTSNLSQGEIRDGKEKSLAFISPHGSFWVWILVVEILRYLSKIIRMFQQLIGAMDTGCMATLSMMP